MLSITQLFQKCQQKFEDYVSAELRSFDDIDNFLSYCFNELACNVMSAFLESLDCAIRDNQKGRMEANLLLIKVKVPRQIQTVHGTVSYKRAYYYNKSTGRHLYAVDELVGIRPYQRLGNTLENEVVNQALCTSYEKASKSFSPVSELSRQTVMNKIRRSALVEEEAKVVKGISVLHIDADEDHVKVRGKKGSIVPLISVYEGVADGKCQNVFHISEYGKKPDDLWEQVLTVIEGRYILSDTKTYLHGDGGAWIRQGLEWIPNVKFVLDKYHKNKYIGKICNVIAEKKERRSLRKKLKSCLLKGDGEGFSREVNGLCAKFPECDERIKKAATYLSNHISGIQICEIDAEANNGGCTEGHVSNVLSVRLSSRPMAWSETTLKVLAPMLAGQRRIYVTHNNSVTATDELKSLGLNAMKKTPQKYARGMPEASSIGAVPLLSSDKVSWLRNALFSLAG